MKTKQMGTPIIRSLTSKDIVASLKLGVQDFKSAPLLGLLFASFFVGAGLLMALITYWTGQTFWLVLAVLGFPMIGTLASIGFYETSRQQDESEPLSPTSIVKRVWTSRGGQMPWLASIVVVVFLFWFFLGHMIFALFLGLSPMTNVSTSLDVFFTPEGAMMLAVGTGIGAVFSSLVFAITIHGMPMLIDREVDFMTAMFGSASAVSKNLVLYLAWGIFIGVVTLISALPMFLGLFVTMPIFGHASWHLYKRLTEPAAT